jgi:streptogramin lyase
MNAKSLKFVALLASAAVGLTAQAQDRAGSANPWIVGPTATPNLGTLPQPKLPYHHAPKLRAPNGQQFGNVSAVALTPAGNLLVLNRNPAIMMAEYDPSGRLIRTFNPNIAINSHGMRVDRHGNIWVVDSFLNVIWKLNPKGEPVMVLGTRGEMAAWDDAKWNGKFNQPLDVAFDRDDNIYVVQSHGGTSNPPSCTLCATYNNMKMPVMQGSDPRVLKFDRQGNYLTSRSFARPEPPFPTMHSVLVTPSGEVWVTDRQQNRILVHDRNLQPLREIQLPVRTSGLFVDARNTVWVAAGMDGLIVRLDAQGRVDGWFGKAGREPSDPEAIGEAHYLAVTPDQRTIYIADSVNAEVHRLDHN